MKEMHFDFEPHKLGVKETLWYDDWNFIDRLKVCKEVLFEKKIMVAYDGDLAKALTEYFSNKK